MAFQTDRRTMTSAQAELAQIDVGLRQYMLGVYNYMASGVALTGIVALLVANTSLQQLFYAQTAQGPQPSILTWGAMLLSLGIVFFLGFRVAKMSVAAVQGTFWGYATLNGIWLSSIFMVYTDVSIARVFFISAASFAGLSLYGYTTKRDLTAMGSFLTMGLIGIVIAMVVNMFLASSALDFAISVIGVLVFAGLTAYDTQKIKEMYWEADGAEVVAKKSVMGALSLYLDFINLFLMLLRFFGERR